MNRLPFRTPSRAMRRSRRGAELVEFALVFPVFLFLFFGIMEFSWYFYQKHVVVDAARSSCRVVAGLDPDDASFDFATIYSDAASAALADNGGFDCGGLHTCNFTLDGTNAVAGSTPRRVACDIDVTYISLTGFLGANPDDPFGPGADIAADAWGTGRGRMLPELIHGRSAAIFEESD